MSEANLIAQEDLSTSNAVAEKMTLKSIPSILMSAFNGTPATVLVNTVDGKTPSVAGVPDNLVTDEAPSESESPVRGLILSEDNIIDIKRYVWEGLKLPTSPESVKQALNYHKSFDETKHPEIAPAAFAELHTKINSHCRQWSDLEASIKKQGTSLKIFGQEFVSTGSDILDVIKQMPIMERVKQSLTKYSEQGKEFSFSSDDVEIRGGLVELLSTIKSAAETHHAEAHKLAERLAGYREEMENQIVPSVNQMNDTLVRLSDSDDTKKLVERKAALDVEIENLSKAYSKLVGYAFTGAAGLVLGPVGIISWAITGGVFGDKAEGIRKKRNDREDERNRIIKDLDTQNHLMEFIANTHSSVSKQCAVLDKALVGVKNLEVMWDSVVQYVDDATNKLSRIDESKSLLLFQNNMEGAVNSWKEVRDITGELIQLFESAAKRAKEMGLEPDQTKKDETEQNQNGITEQNKNGEAEQNENGEAK